VTAMNRGPALEDQQRAGHLAQQRGENGDDISGIDGLVLAVSIRLALRRDGADGREMIPRPLLPQNRGLAYRGLGADDPGQWVKPRFIYKQDGLLRRLSPFLRAGQVSPRQRVMAASPRRRQRGAGFCGLRRSARHKRPTWRGCRPPSRFSSGHTCRSSSSSHLGVCG
jgi:hypothetical protein